MRHAIKATNTPTMSGRPASQVKYMMNEARAHPDYPLATKVREQADIMRDQITRQLERARLAARAAVLGTVTEVRPVVTSLARTMEKIHRDRGIAIDLDAPEDARFRGEQQDLEEMVGNLVDNAGKWARHVVTITIGPEPWRSVSERRFFHVTIDDDGEPPCSRRECGRAQRRAFRTF